MADKTIVAIVRRYLASVCEAGIPVSAGVLYGSFAHGKPTAESDIDLLVVSPVFDGPKVRALVDKLWELTWRTDSRIEPIPVGVNEFATDLGSPLICVAREEGVIIHPDQSHPASSPVRQVAEAPARYMTKRTQKAPRHTSR